MIDGSYGISLKRGDGIAVPAFAALLAAPEWVLGQSPWLSYILAFGSVILAFRLWNRAGLRRGHVALAGLALVKVALCVLDECDAAPFEKCLRENGNNLPSGCHLEFLSDQ